MHGNFNGALKEWSAVIYNVFNTIRFFGSDVCSSLHSHDAQRFGSELLGLPRDGTELGVCVPYCSNC